MTGSCSKSLREFRLLKYIKNRMAQRVCTMEQICHRWSLFVSLPCSKINADFMAMGCMVLATQGLVGKIYPRLHSIHDLLVIPAPDSIWILLRQIGIHIFHDINDINLIYIYIYNKCQHLHRLRNLHFLRATWAWSRFWSWIRFPIPQLSNTYMTTVYVLYI